MKKLEADQVVSLMRRHKVTIRTLSERTGITMKRIRRIRSAGLRDGDALAALDWVEAITGSKMANFSVSDPSSIWRFVDSHVEISR